MIEPSTDPAATTPTSQRWARRLQFSVKQLLIAVAIVGLLLGIWLWFFRTVVYCRPANETDEVQEQYFCIDERHVAGAQNVAVFEGRFGKDTWVEAELYLLKSGRIEQAGGFVVGRSPNRIGEPRILAMKLTLALASWTVPLGRATELGCAGHTRGSGAMGYVTSTIAGNASSAVTTRILPGRQYVVYAEGDVEPMLGPEMSLDDFMAKNPGDFLVVTARVQ